MDSQGFDSELRTYYNEVKGEIKRDHSKYISKHPELRELLNDFLSTVMLEKPQDVYEYAQQFFSYYNIDKDKIVYKPLVISGPSGSGKGTLVQAIIDKYPNQFQKSISYTTRKPLPKETDGVEYFFVSREEFQNEIAKNSFFEHSEYQGEFYGTHKGKLESIVSACKVAILEIDVQGAEKIHKEHSDWNFLFLNAPTLEDLEQRMRAKMIAAKDEFIKERLRIAQEEIKESQKYAYFHLIINEDFELSVEEIENYLKLQYGDLSTEKQ